MGLCGTPVLRDGQIHGLGRLSSAAIRVARQVKGAAAPVERELLDTEGKLCSTLILAPPGAGKTTLLRDLIRMTSQGEGMAPQRVAVADERGEVAALEGCPKAQALMMLLRAMNPQVLAADEITAPEDVAALISAAGCGVKLLATAHGSGQEDLSRRPLYRQLMEARVFERLLLIRTEKGHRSYRVEVLA